MASFLRLSLATLLAFLAVAQCDQSIPALLWSPEKSMSHLPEVNGVKAVKTEDFLGNYLKPLMTDEAHSAVVFLQDKLHVDDFTKYADVYSLESNGGAFKNIKSLMEEHFSLELPQVEDPHVAVEKLKTAFKGNVHTAKSAEDVEKLGLKSDQSFLLIIELSPVSGQLDKEKAIQQNDETVGAVTDHLQKNRIKYSALFTGASAGAANENDVDVYSNRHLLAATENVNGTFMNASNGQVYVYLYEAFVCVKNGSDAGCPLNFTLIPTESTASNSSQDNTTATINLAFMGITPNNKTDKYDVEIITDAVQMGDRWVMHRMYLNVRSISGGEMELINATLNPGDIDIVVPRLYSWHCSELQLFVDHLRDPASANNSGSYIKMSGYQVQPFDIMFDRFFYAQDCVGFFTRAIWMGLFSTLVLIGILLFGVLMILNLSTMDKYDDPKGKTIIIPQGND